MIGIKGVGMTMLAEYLLNLGYEISGSDTEEKFMTDQVLKKAKIKVLEGFSEKNIPGDADLIIYSTAYSPENNPELAKAKRGKTKLLSYAEALGEVFNSSYGIAVCGSHGKTTTSAWLAFVLREAGLSPSAMIGARIEQFNGASLFGKSNYLIVEADEYQNKLKYFSPKAVLLNNIDYDHPDFFKTKDDYLQVFIDFIKKIPKKGFLIANFEDKNVKKIANVNCLGRVISYGFDKNFEYSAYDIKQNNLEQIFKVRLKNGDELGEFSISLLGKHNVLNALAVIAGAVELGVDLFKIRTYLQDFKGAQRRMQILGKYKGALIIDDYAHHPAEIKTTLEGLKKAYPAKNLRVVFHPHTFTRTKAFFNDFLNSFDLADEVIFLDIYGSAREKQGGVSSADLAKNIKNARHIPGQKEVLKYLQNTVKKNDLILLMGAGDVFRIGEKLIS